MTGFLASYWYFKKYDWTDFPGPLIIDSGAFSAFTTGAVIDLPEYARYVKRVMQETPEGFSWAVNLDVIGDSEGSYRQWRELRDEHGVDTVPVIHHGSNPQLEIDRYLAHGLPRLAFGGLVGGGQKNLPWAAACLKYVASIAPEVLTHGLGVVEGSMSGRLPWDTTDSSASTAAVRFGAIRLLAPGTQGGLKSLDLRTMVRPSRGDAALMRSFGITPSDIRGALSLPTRERNILLVRLSWRSVVREELHENRRRAATRARTGLETPRDVTRFVVQGSSGFAPFIQDEMNNPRELPAYGPGVVR